MSIKKPIIGISSDIIELKNTLYSFKAYSVKDMYANSINASGGVSLVLPVTDDDNLIKEYVKLVNGIVLTGGKDINPLRWNEEPREKIGAYDNLRDSFDLKLLKYAIEYKKPILGICRGLQVINVFLGGTLYQDVSYSKGQYIKHIQGSDTHVGTHKINIDENSMLHSVLGSGYLVNSLHHLSVKDLGKNLKVTAMSNDGIIEAIESTNEDYIFAVQFHPEAMSLSDEGIKRLFDKFVSDCV